MSKLTSALFVKAIAATLCFMVIFLGCASEEKANTESEPTTDHQFPTYVAKKASNRSITGIETVVSDFKKIVLSKAVTDKIRYIFHFFVIDDERIVLVDEDAGAVVLIDTLGELLWHISTESNDYRFPTEIDECSFNRFSKEIVIQNGFQNYYFDLEGKPTRKKPSGYFNYHQICGVSPTDVLYSCQGFENAMITTVPKQLIWQQNEEIKDLFIDRVYHAPRSIFVGGFDEFEVFNGQLSYHASLRDTVYRIALPKVEPDFVLKFPGRETQDDIMRRESLKYKLGYLHENGIPVISNIAADDDKLIMTYTVGGWAKAFSAILDRNTDQWLFNSAFLRYKDEVFRSPKLYDNGYLLALYPKPQADHFAKIPLDADEVSRAWMEESEAILDNYSDDGELLLYLVTL